MAKLSWQDSSIEKFKAEDDTIFVKGPFVVDNYKYDYKLIDENGEDFCNISQMIMWNVKMIEQINEE